ncbi:MAG: hypothetical protein MUF81_12515 [Verrucomicrobia bacterium]|nr:hypothetical protein [Verrucomicrobiota bacterium]
MQFFTGHAGRGVTPSGVRHHLIGGGAGSNSVILLNSLAGPVSNEEFDTLTPSASAYLKNNAISDPSSIVAHQGGPVTVLVRTRAGRYGVLQITGFTENPRGVGRLLASAFPVSR